MSEDRNEIVLRAWAAGLPSRQIARNLGMTRNAILGVVYRARKAGHPCAVSRADERIARIKASSPARPKGDPEVLRQRRNDYAREYHRRKAAQRLAAAYGYVTSSGSTS